MDISYITLTQLKRHWETNNSNNATVSNPVMASYARIASDVINNKVQMEFAPRIETRYYDTFGIHIDRRMNTIMLDKPIVELTSTTLGDNTSLTTDTDVRLFPRGHVPAIELQIYYPNTSTWFDYTNDPIQSIAITGVWCWRDRYNTDGWKLSGQTVQDAGGINSTVTEITVTDIDGSDRYASTPLFDVGQMIKIDSEYMAIVATNTTTNKMTVIRGIRGSTVAAHNEDAAISIFIPNPDIQRATLLLAHANYIRRGTIDVAVFDDSAASAGMEMPEEVNMILQRYKTMLKWMTI